ncbi:hypothetical protein EDC61_10546 [Sulfuritortus calidifontis]|uniref:Uncharacterized protein n=1 Tax=Sulfuritortus calidifontis TaxID=1914471 RepID=A0A4R3JXY2_9PROT|nr:hypothetical protein [Sulfuritortus calidifontis]TCS72392.1 hypothetical protein EDC61_10546 [Sulfuritortus calidifontis]
MSKLEDKLKASLKPAARKGMPATAAAKVPARSTTQAPLAKPVPAGSHRREPELNDANQALHPRRIWPD